MVLSCESLKKKIAKELNASHVEVHDDSDGCGQKFRVVVVSPLFEGKPMLQCHKLVNAALKEELQQIHAFSQKTFSPSQWEKTQSATCSAPGKVILFGEHSVVYKKTAVAACVSKRTKVCIATHPECVILMDMPEVGLNQFKIELPENESLLMSTGKLNNSLLGSLLEDPGIINFGSVDRSNNALINRLDWWASMIENHSKVKFSEQALSVLAYLHSFLTPNGKFNQGLSVKVTSDIRPGAGLGSSAAYAVALAGAFGKLFEANLDNAKVKELAWQAERLVHGKPSGLDTTVVCDGENVRFPILEGVTLPRPAWPLRVLLVDSGVARNTKKMVEIAAAKIQEIGTGILDEMDKIAIDAIDALALPQSQGYKIIEVLVEKNQKCLEQLGVSHPALDLICSIAEKFGLKAKITGAGGGGNAFILLPPDITTGKLQELQTDLDSNHFISFEVALFGAGIVYE
ncbi:mevalonate kinase isoform X2 [Neocloeon triangulifer]|uniref:mevalonate kinase isoform X2 n=1 Tax=Neocloeon triangulifer TaxID=2078957 RepID=UPI00286F7582|nr:mevalonate kinase isoform X2 [Neocloeon triangulifer]